MTTKQNETTKEINKKKSCGTHVCSHKFAFMLDNPLRKLFQNPRKIVGQYIQPGDTVIDFGCGPGFFSTEMAHLVGSNGKVIAVDLQEEMLKQVKRKAKRKKITDRMKYHKCSVDRVGLELKEQADFMLAFYMLHETTDPAAFLAEVKQLLKPGGKLLVVEPKMHVSQELYNEMLEQAKTVGFNVVNTPAKKGGRSMLLTV